MLVLNSFLFGSSHQELQKKDLGRCWEALVSMGGLGEEVRISDGGHLWMGDDGGHSNRTIQAMSEEQLSALLAKLKDDVVLREKLQGAAGLDVAVAMAQDAGFDVEMADWLKYQESLPLEELSDDQLESVAGGVHEAKAIADSEWCGPK